MFQEIKDAVSVKEAVSFLDSAVAKYEKHGGVNV